MEVKNLTVNFTTEEGTVNALDNLSLEIRDGETLGVLGESGSGKTTLALAILALLADNADIGGEVKFAGDLITAHDISGRAVTKLNRKQRKMLGDKLSELRWKGISMVFQGSMNAFNPVYTIEKQLAEVFRLHTEFDDEEIKRRVKMAVEHVGLSPVVLKSYPHELSGGMKQRAVIAMALALRPKLVIADEPTTGLDVIIQAKIIQELKQLRKSDIKSMLLISHDIGVVAQLADRIAVLYAGRLMELGSVRDIFHNSANPYTRALIRSYPSVAQAKSPIEGIPGSPPDPIAPPNGCRFAMRCRFVTDLCREKDPPLVEVAPGHLSACHYAQEILRGRVEEMMPTVQDVSMMQERAGGDRGETIVELDNIMKYFDLRGSLFGSIFGREGRRVVVHAVDRITLNLKKGEIVGVVGESGSGKTTLGRTILKLIEPTAGRILYSGGRSHPGITAGAVDGDEGNEGSKKKSGRRRPLLRFRHAGGDEGNEGDRDGTGLSDITLASRGDPLYELFRRDTQLVFQDPYDSLNPKMTIFDIVQEPVLAHRITKNPVQVVTMVKEALSTVNLRPPDNYMERFPHELSGGERQRVAAARALVLRPDFLVADEPISMLDVSLRAGFLNLLLKLRRDFDLTMLYITHDIASARYVSDRILVMYLGVGVEFGDSEEVVKTPLHPYSKALIQAVPLPTPDWNPGELEILGEIGNAVNVPRGCRFYNRCIYSQPKCLTEPPPQLGGENHWYLCHFTQDELITIKSVKQKEKMATAGPEKEK